MVRITNDVRDAIIMIGTFLYTWNRTCYLKEKCIHNLFMIKFNSRICSIIIIDFRKGSGKRKKKSEQEGF